MSAGEYCDRDVIITERSESIRVAVDLMRQHHVGDVVVVEKENGSAKLVGILTDRDIIIEILAEDIDLGSVAAGDVMSHELNTVGEETRLMDAIKQMRAKSVRRLPARASMASGSPCTCGSQK